MVDVKDVILDRDYYNSVKGLGIFCVIVGHACMFSQHFVYLFHLQLFFFLSGYFYSEKKYGRKPFLNVINKLKTTWKTYVILYIIVILLHNVLIDMGLQPLAYEKYSMREMGLKLLGAFFGNGSELMAGPAWFLAILVITSIVLGFIISLSILIEQLTKSTLIKLLFQAFVIVSMAIIGYPLILNQVHFFANVQYVLVVIPYMWLGYVLRNYVGDITRYIKPVVGLICALIVYWFSTFEWVDITIGHVFPYMYIATAFGLYMALSLSQILNNVPILNRLIRFMGDNSLAIMIVHFPVLRLIDKFIATVIYTDPTGELFNHIPVAFEHLWYVYMIVDVPVTLFIVLIWVKLKGAVTNKPGKA